VLLSQFFFNSIVDFTSRKDLIRQPEIGENVLYKPSVNYE